MLLQPYRMVKYKVIFGAVNVFVYIMHFISHFYGEQIRLYTDNRLEMSSHKF